MCMTLHESCMRSNPLFVQAFSMIIARNLHGNLDFKIILQFHLETCKTEVQETCKDLQDCGHFSCNMQEKYNTLQDIHANHARK